MAQNDIDQLAEAIIDKMKQGHHAVWLDPETHSTQHEFLKMLIDERAEHAARRKRIEEKIAGSLILSAVLVLIGFIGAGAMAWLRRNI
jgi:hypothetical protein